MRLENILASFMSDMRTFYRSKGTLFWTLAFPVMLILIFGAIFSGVGDVEYELHVQNLDDSDQALSHQFIQALESTGIIKVVNVSKDADINDYMDEKDIKRLLVISEDYSNTIIASQNPNENVTVNLTFHYDQSEQQTNQVVKNIISSVVRSMNMGITGGKEIIGIKDVETISGEFNFIDFFLPGMIGFTIMQTAIYGTIERNVRLKKDGILRKLLTTPITRSEWIFSKMLFQLFLAFLSAFLIIMVGILVYGLNIHITLLMIILIIATSFLFTGLGMLIGRFVRDEESAGMAGGAITFPMMFLAGTFFPLEQMPEFLQAFAKILPLYYVNEGLRNAMIYLKTDDALFH